MRGLSFHILIVQKMHGPRLLPTHAPSTCTFRVFHQSVPIFYIFTKKKKKEVEVPMFFIRECPLIGIRNLDISNSQHGLGTYLYKKKRHKLLVK